MLSEIRRVAPRRSVLLAALGCSMLTFASPRAALANHEIAMTHSFVGSARAGQPLKLSVTVKTDCVVSCSQVVVRLHYNSNKMLEVVAPALPNVKTIDFTVPGADVYAPSFSYYFDARQKVCGPGCGDARGRLPASGAFTLPVQSSFASLQPSLDTPLRPASPPAAPLAVRPEELLPVAATPALCATA